MLWFGLEQGVEVLLWDNKLFSTTTEWDPSNREDQLGASVFSSCPIRKRPSVSSILLWIMSVMLSNLLGEFIPKGDIKLTNDKGNSQMKHFCFLSPRLTCERNNSQRTQRHASLVSHLHVKGFHLHASFFGMKKNIFFFCEVMGKHYLK